MKIGMWKGIVFLEFYYSMKQNLAPHHKDSVAKKQVTALSRERMAPRPL